MKKRLFFFGVAVLLASAAVIQAQVTDYGDAPEGALAYPDLGIVGAFPTCTNVGAANTYIRHNYQFAYWGATVDTEVDGNAGSCPAFNPNSYNHDEGGSDGDAGLITPAAYTIQGDIGSERVVPCSSSATSLGFTCTEAFWGPNIDMQVTNLDPANTKYVNVLIDWNQDGAWGGSVQCGSNTIPEHVLINQPVPAGFSGSLSFLYPPAFRIGPNAGFVWVRFSITDVAVAAGSWTGSGTFNDGETEDYLLEVQAEDELDWGDAPDAPYPTLAVDNGACHQISHGFYLGSAVDADADGQPTVDALGDNADGDPVNDEDGVQFLSQIVSNHTAVIVVTASQAGYLDAWIDYNINDSWDDVGEKIYDAYPLTAGSNTLIFTVPTDVVEGPSFARFRLSRLGGLPPTGYSPDGEVEDYPVELYTPVEITVWQAEALDNYVRLHWITQSESENMGFQLLRSESMSGPFVQINTDLIIGAGNSQVEHDYSYEDRQVLAGRTYYYKLVDVGRDGSKGMHGPVQALVQAPTEFSLEQNYPNPFNPTTTIRFNLKESGFVSLIIFNLQGQKIRTLVEDQMNLGLHQVVWDSRDEFDQTVASGVYLYTLQGHGYQITRRMNLIR
jgi:hypothetical protein